MSEAASPIPDDVASLRRIIAGLTRELAAEKLDRQIEQPGLVLATPDEPALTRGVWLIVHTDMRSAAPIRVVAQCLRDELGARLAGRLNMKLPAPAPITVDEIRSRTT